MCRCVGLRCRTLHRVEPGMLVVWVSDGGCHLFLSPNWSWLFGRVCLSSMRAPEVLLAAGAWVIGHMMYEEPGAWCWSGIEIQMKRL